MSRDKQNHPENSAIFQLCLERAADAGLGIAIFHTNKAKWAGVWRYTLHTGAERPYGIRDKRVVDWWETPNSKWGKPSIKGERECLEGMELWLKQKEKKQEIGLTTEDCMV